MIGFGKTRARIGALEAANAALSTQLMALSARQAETEGLHERLSALEAIVAELNVTLAGQAAALEVQRAAFAQLQADMFRVDRQSAHDIDALRRTSAAIAETLLLERKRAGRAVAT